jgi:hypothetical protein
VRALAIKEREYGRDHREVARTLDNLGIAWRELGQPAKARELHERALAIEEREYGRDHRDVAGTLGSLGNAWLALGGRPRPASCTSGRWRSRSASTAGTTAMSPGPSTTSGPRGATWDSRPRPASCTCGRCASLGCP